MNSDAKKILARVADTIRVLSAEAIEEAKSGHPGLPLGCAELGAYLFSHVLRHNPANPDWAGRDRFILSAGHGSMFLYSLLHLTGYEGVTADQLAHFRRLGSKTPGHPELGETAGVEVTTGPLGQGLANAVGMAIAERRMAEEFNRPGHEIIDHWTYGICSDGDLQEGIASEAASLAGHLRLGKLVFLYDDNHIQLDGPTAMAFSEDVLARFRAYGWHTLRVKDGTDVGAIEAAIRLARTDDRPSIIAVRTVIGFGSPNKAGSQKAHGAPLGPDEVRLTKEAYGWDPDKSFFVPDAAAALFSRAIPWGEELTGRWNAALERYRAAFPAEAAELERRLDGDLRGGWDAALPRWEAGAEVATRNASADTINALAAGVPELFGGSADLSESNLTDVKGGGDFTAEHAGRNIRFGVREHAMGGIGNGLAYHSGYRPYVATFLTFSDYMRGSVRLAALSGLPVVYDWTHDSVGLGEDGPTHQPVEHLAALRAIPGAVVLRPADANETVAAWRFAMTARRPTLLALSRQKLPVLPLSAFPQVADGVARGGYVLADAPGAPDAVVVASGSEVHLALEAREALAAEGIAVRVVSMPSTGIFAEQPAAYRESVIPADVPVISAEAGVTLGWRTYLGQGTVAVGIDRFGASAPGETVLAELGITAAHIADAVRSALRPPR